MAFENPNVYGTGNNASINSTGTEQLNPFYFQKKALIELVKEQYFGQMANTTAMPKNMGKTIKRYHYLPILDDRNLNDQGIDASGAVQDATSKKVAYVKAVAPNNAGGETFYFRGDHTTTAGALAIAEGKVISWLLSLGFNAATDNYAGLTALAIAAGYTFDNTTYVATNDNNYGNLYGSSKDVGTISGKIPVLTENGGRVNRVGHKRIDLEGTLSKFGFFDEYTQESIDFDSDSELMMHINREMLRAANEITEDQLQIDLLNSAGVIRYTGNAVSTVTLNGGTTLGAADVISYDDLVKLGIELDNNRCPKNTTVITGSRMVDTKVVNAARYIYIGSELLPSIMRMTDYHSNKAFIPVAQYGSAGTIARGEVGAVDSFRFIVVPEMMHWDAAGATLAAGTEDDGELFRFSADSTGALKYNVYPMLVVGDESFTTVGFQTDGKSTKFKINHKKPSELADRNDPYGETGFMSIKWYYGFMILRPERIALLKTVAEW